MNAPDKTVRTPRRYRARLGRVFLGCGVLYLIVGGFLFAINVYRPFLIALVPSIGIFFFLIVSIPNHKRKVEREYGARKRQERLERGEVEE